MQNEETHLGAYGERGRLDGGRKERIGGPHVSKREIKKNALSLVRRARRGNRADGLEDGDRPAGDEREHEEQRGERRRTQNTPTHTHTHTQRPCNTPRESDLFKEEKWWRPRVWPAGAGEGALKRSARGAVQCVYSRSFCEGRERDSKAGGGRGPGPFLEFLREQLHWAETPRERKEEGMW
jgi:hypothetical protein